MEKELLMLGLIRMGLTYGYQLNEFINTHMKALIHLKKPTAYSILARMTKEGWIDYKEEQSGNRPLRRVYTITEEGEKVFRRFMRETMGHYRANELINDIPIMFLESLSTEEAVKLLKDRQEEINDEIANTLSHAEAHKGTFSWVIDHQRRQLQTDLEWLSDIIQELE